MNPSNEVVIDSKKKNQAGVGDGYPQFSVPLYTTTPNLSAAVAAAIEQAAQQCFHSDELRRIRALQSPDGLAALRELCSLTAQEVSRIAGISLSKSESLAIADRVLKGG